MLNCVAVFPDERNVFYREHADGTYSSIPFSLSYWLAEIPFEIIASLLLAVACQLVIGMQVSPMHFLMFAVVNFCLIHSGESFGIMFCGLVYEPGLGVNFTNIVLTYFLLTAGLFSLDMPQAIQIINKGSILNYSMKVLSVNEFTGLKFSCPPSQALPTGLCFYQTGEQVLEQYKMNLDPLWFNFGMVLALTVIYRVVSWGVMHWSAKRRKFAQ
eukprot:TRINITY_DN9045_c0_g1_i2.p1 TRINITY_DN9045_c0_g1~~TRINITY_DN9045_c0_g1_i2.p1  ORF type:complete len:214 (-),score=35.85 TRINITY_DN9045_c0_g1_i2:53-694(-)